MSLLLLSLLACHRGLDDTSCETCALDCDGDEIEVSADDDRLGTAPSQVLIDAATTDWSVRWFDGALTPASVSGNLAATGTLQDPSTAESGCPDLALPPWITVDADVFLTTDDGRLQDHRAAGRVQVGGHISAPGFSGFLQEHQSASIDYAAAIELDHGAPVKRVDGATVVVAAGRLELRAYGLLTSGLPVESVVFLAE